MESPVQFHQIDVNSLSSEEFSFNYEVYNSASSLAEEDAILLQKAGEAALQAYAPYSGFRVGVAAELVNGEIITGCNQENASYPAGICAEGATMAVAAAKFPNVGIKNMAISYRSTAVSDHPIAPCGICRQQMDEFRHRTMTPIRLILGGVTGKVIIVDDSSRLLPFSFRF
jgi:cytidine deaminase